MHRRPAAELAKVWFVTTMVVGLGGVQTAERLHRKSVTISQADRMIQGRRRGWYLFYRGDGEPGVPVLRRLK